MRVLLADDHAMFRKGVLHCLLSTSDIQVVGEATTGREALQMALRLQPDLVLMDINMPEMDGVEATRLIKQQSQAMRVLILTISDVDKDLFEAIKVGADGYLLKDLAPDDLVAAVRSAAEGESPISPVMAARLLREFRHGRTRGPAIEGQQLSPREVEVLQLASQGLTYKEIAVRLYVAESTIKNHMHHILEKLHLRNRSEAVRYAFKEGLTGEVRDQA